MGEQMEKRGIEAPLSAFPPPEIAAATHPSHLEKWLTHNIYQFVLQHDEPHLFGLGHGAHDEAAVPVFEPDSDRA
jgi:hypothetical protein